MQVVIDSCILGWANDKFDCMRVLTTVVERHVIAMDTEGHLLREYQQFLMNSPLIGQWFANISRSRQLILLSGSIGRSLRAELIALGADRNDLPQMGVASRTDCHIIIHEDGGYDGSENLLRVIRSKLPAYPMRSSAALSAL